MAEIKNKTELNDLLRSIHSEKKVVDLAKKSHINPSYISMWKKGHDLTYDQCMKLATSLGHTIKITIS